MNELTHRTPATRAQLITSIRRDRLIDYLTGRRVLLLPEGTRLLGIWIETEWDDGNEHIEQSRIMLRLAHDSFPETPDGCPIPGGRAETASRLTGLGLKPAAARGIIQRAKVSTAEDDKAISRAEVPFHKYKRRRIIEVEEEEFE